MRHFSYWESELPPESPIPVLPNKVDVLIVGAGFMGRWLAHFIGDKARTLVVERDRFSYGASTRNAGFLTCGQVSEMLEDARHAGVDAVIETFLQRREGIALARSSFPGFEIEPCGSADYDEVTDEKRELAVLLNNAAGEKVYTVREARFGGEARPAIFNAADGALHPVKLLRAIAERSQADYAFGVTVKRIGNGTCELETQGGTYQIGYERAFVCTNGFAANLDTSTRVEPGRGQVIVTNRLATDTARTLGYLNAGYDYFRFVDGRLLVGGGRNRFHSEQGVQELDTTAEVREHLKALAARIAGHGEFTIDHHWAGIMGFVGGAHLGGSPRRRLDSKTEMLAGFGGMGVALTPRFAQQVASEL